MFILVGFITGAHGIKGEVRIKVFAEDPRSLVTYSPLHSSDGRAFIVRRIKPQRDHSIAAIDDVMDRNAAEALRGTELYADRSKLGGDTLLADLIGRQVTAHSSLIGTIIGFQNYGAGELMELDTGLLIPMRFAVETGKQVTVELPEGFLDTASKD
jgi:16S rRNA processing protein RimM